MKIISQDIVNFVSTLLDDDGYKKLFSDVWIEFNSIYNLYLHVNNIEEKISKLNFSRKLIFVSESNSFGLHYKKVWNNSKRVSLLIVIPLPSRNIILKSCF